MAQRLRYTGEPVLTLQDVEAQVQGGLPADQQQLVTDVIIPAVTAQAEAITGAAIREAEYAEHWPAGGRASGWLDKGQVKSIVSVKLQGSDQSLPPSTYSLHIEQRLARLQLHFVSPPPPLTITYIAGLNLEVYPSVKQWLLMQAATLFAQRELLANGVVAAVPTSYVDSLLSDITLPPRF